MNLKPNVPILNLCIPIVLLLGVLPVLKSGDFDSRFWVNLEVVFPPRHSNNDVELGEIEYFAPICWSNINILVGPCCYFYFPYDSILRSDEVTPANLLGKRLPELTILGESQLLDLLCEHQEDCPNYPIRFSMLPEARFEQMITMLMWMRSYRVPWYVITRISESERCAVRELGDDLKLEKVTPRCQVEPYLFTPCLR